MSPLEELQTKYDLLATYVKRLRKYQMQYEAYHNKKDYNNIVRYQRYIDNMLVEGGPVNESKQLEISDNL